MSGANEVAPPTCEACGEGPLKVRMRVDVEVDALGFLATSVVIDGSIFDDDVWQVDEVYCDSCGQTVHANDYEVGNAVAVR